MANYDIIIVGAGLAGLTAGAKLAKEGRKILLIEQQSKMGGCATSFQRKVEALDGAKVTFEVGLHEMDGLGNENNPKNRIFEEFNIFDKVEFIQVPEFYRFTNGRVDIVIPHNVQEAIKVLIEEFPDEKEGINKFFYDIEQTYLNYVQGNLMALVDFNQLSIGEYLDTITSNEDLKFVLIANLGYYGDDPYTIAMIPFSIAQYSYYSGGGYFIKGGSQILSDSLASVIEDNGGEIIRKHLVTEIITREGKTIGVTYKHKNRQDLEERQAFAKVILSNAAIPNLVNSLVPALQNTDYQKQVNSMEIACSLFSLYLAFSESPTKLGNEHYSTIVSEIPTSLKEYIPNEKSDDFTKKGFVFVDYSVFDSHLSEAGYIGAICGIDYLENWKKLPEDEYKKKKEAVTNILIDRLDKLIPGIKEIVVFAELATPRTIVRYTQNPGTVYGFAQTIEQTGPKIQSLRKPPIENLYCASAWTGMGGFSGAILGGYSCAIKILKET